MSSVRGASSRGRGRGSTQQPATRGRGASSSRGSAFGTTSQRGNATTRGTFGQSSRPSATRPPRGSNAPRANATSSQASSARGAFHGARMAGSPQERFQALTKARERERADAIRRGLIADPDKPRSLADAITLVGTCQDMCPEYERAQRILQDDVWAEETDPNHSGDAVTEKPPNESRMVKKFRRSAAGLEEQLPSDLRPPPVLKRTCDYLFDDVIGYARSLADVHHFVWDRTRAIRNDFSIQQVQKREELQIAIECYERIARFHIMSLHQLALPEKPYSKYDWQQEREQLDRTLLSLVQLYDDSREKLELPNEAEFRAYCVILQLQDPTPDLEDRIQSWPRHILEDRRVQKAREVYMAACNIMDPQGPLKPRADHLIAREDWQKFWTLVASKEVSYLMACAAEVYFNLVRRTVLNALFRTSWPSHNKDRSRSKTIEWTVDALCDLLAFDNVDEVYTYCEHFGFAFNEREDGQHYLDLTSVGGTTLPEPTAGIPKQSKSRLVEDKRFDRILPAIIDGLSVRQAQIEGMIAEGEGEEEIDMEDVDNVQDQSGGTVDGQRSSDPFDDGESLFLPEARKPSMVQSQTPMSLPNGAGEMARGPQSTLSGFGTGFNFGQPTTFGASSSNPASVQHNKSEEPASSASKFNFLQPSKPAPTAASTFNFTGGSTATDTNTNGRTEPDPVATVSTEQPRSSDSIFSKPTASSSGTAPSRFQFSTAPATTTTNMEEMISPKSNATPSLAAPASIPSANIETSGSQPARSQFSFAQPAGASATALPSQASKSPEMKVSQPHFTASPPSPPSTFNPHPSTPALNSGTRKLSTSKDHRPEKPSPLSHSFTAGEDSSAIVDSQRPEDLFARQSSRAPFPIERSEATGSRSAVKDERSRSASDTASEDFAAVVAKIADEFYTDPIRGILKQYIDYHVRHTVREVQDQIESEQREEEADRHHRFRLQKKYGNRWRDLFWQRRLAKSGRERRERRQRRLQQRSSQELEGGSLFDATSSRAHSEAPSAPGAENFGVRQSVEFDIYGRPMSDHGKSHAPNRANQAHAGMKRPMSSHGPEENNHARQHAHKRMKSTSHIDDRGRITKPSSTSHPNNDILKRSAFLGFSQANGGGHIKNTTKSNYFRLKALGVHRVEESIAPRGTKRRLSGSVQDTIQTSPPALRSPSLNRSTSGQANDRAFMPPPSSTPVHPAKIDNDDEELFARLKAARENLMDSTSFYKSEVGKDEDLRQSLNSSQSSNEFESPSMVKARLDARMRASHRSSEGRVSAPRSDVPAYRMRESRFVPRENYGKAIERAKEIRESRSRETSRPESPQVQSATHHESKKQSAPKPTFGAPSPPTGQTNFTVASAKGPNGVSHKQSPPKGLSAFPPGSTSTSFTSRAPINFANHTTEISSENPFLNAPVGKGFTSFVPQQTSKSPFLQPASASNNSSAFGSQQASTFKDKTQGDTDLQDFTIQPSQINQALSNSFGGSHGYGTNRLLSMPQDVNTPPQQDSYLQSRTISLISDDEDEDAPATATQHQPVESAMDTEATEEALDESSGEGEFEHESAQMNGHVNPYTLLARHEYDEEDEQSFDSQDEPEDGYDEEEDDRIPNGYGDEDAVDGDIDEDETDDMGEDEDAHELEYSEDEEGETPPDYEQQQEYDARWAANPPKTAAFQGVGNTVEEAIELSD